MQRTNLSSGRPWEAIVGYSRAVRVGNQIWVTGTVDSDEGGNVGHPGDAGAQAAAALATIKKVIEELGGTLEGVVRTRMFVTDISQWEEIGRAHGKVFGEIRPATTMVEVSKLISPGFLVEIEADAVII